jgi:hypothetical protein
MTGSDPLISGSLEDKPGGQRRSPARWYQIRFDLVNFGKKKESSEFGIELEMRKSLSGK